jgi:hypothetical protein
VTPPAGDVAATDAPPPSELSGRAALLAVANTRHEAGGHYNHRASLGDPAHDHLADAADARDFLDRHRDGMLPDGAPDGASLLSLRRVRDAVHALVAGDPEAAAACAAWLSERATFRLGTDGRLSPASSGWPGFVDQLLPAMLGLLGAGERLRACANPVCGWIYVDESRNASRTWCDSTRCGNQQRVRRHREKRARGELHGAMPTHPPAG